MGEADLRGAQLPDALTDIRVRHWYGLSLEGTPATPPTVLARVAGDPWLVEGTADGGGRYLLLASPLDAESSTLPVSTGMVRFLDWAASQWAASGGGATSALAGEALSAPRGATVLRLPGDSTVAVDGSRTYRDTRRPGFYTFLAGDSVLSVHAVNPAPGESQLAQASDEVVTAALGPEAVLVGDGDEWARSIFRVRQGPEVWRALLLGALLLLLVEAFLAASGGAVRRRGDARSAGAVHG